MAANSGASPPISAKITPKAYLIGEAAEEFAQTLAGHAPAEVCGTLETAVARAAEDATEAAAVTGDDAVVLFSPACASYDQFRNFEERGERFKELVRGLG